MYLVSHVSAETLITGRVICSGTNIPSAVVSTQWWQYNVDIIVIAHESFLEQLLSGTINIEILERQIT